MCVPTAWVTGFDRKPPNPDGLCPQAEGAVLQANLSQVFIACASQVGTFGDLLGLFSWGSHMPLKGLLSDTATEFCWIF